MGPSGRKPERAKFEIEKAAWPQYAQGLAQNSFGIGKVLEGVERVDKVKAFIDESQPGGIHPGEGCAANTRRFVQPLDANVDSDGSPAHLLQGAASHAIPHAQIEETLRPVSVAAAHGQQPLCSLAAACCKALRVILVANRFQRIGPLQGL